MNADRSGRGEIGRDEVERVLRDAAGGPRPGQDPLTAFLAAAAAPAHEDELAGEEAAVAAFRRARLASPSRRRPMFARLLTVKAAVALGLATTAIGGVALAAASGTLPGYTGVRRPASHRASAHPLTTGLPAAPGGGGGAPASVPSSAGPTPSPSPAPRPVREGENRGKANGNGTGKANSGNKNDKKPKKSHTPHSATPENGNTSH
jgi:hypothetical protein